MSGPKNKHGGGDTGTPAPSDWARIAPYALVSLFAFLLAAGLLFLLVFRAQSLTQFTLIGHVFYVLLVVLGLCAAAFLFGVLKSVGELKGRYLGLLSEKCKRRSGALNPWSCGQGEFGRVTADLGNVAPSPRIFGKLATFFFSER